MAGLYVFGVVVGSSASLIEKNERSVDHVTGSGGVEGLEGGCGALVEEGLGFEALVLIVTVGAHAGLEFSEVEGAETGKNFLAGGALIFTSEAGGGASGCVQLTR